VRASPCPIQPMPAGSKTDPLLAKAEPISNGGRHLWDNIVKKGEKKKIAAGERSETM